jgi:hypothetical protein
MLPVAPLVKHGRLEESKAAAAQLIMLTQSGRGECLLVADTVAKVFQATKRATLIRRQRSRGKEDSKRCARRNEHCAANPSS